MSLVSWMIAGGPPHLDRYAFHLQALREARAADRPASLRTRLSARIDEIRQNLAGQHAASIPDCCAA